MICRVCLVFANLGYVIVEKRQIDRQTDREREGERKREIKCVCEREREGGRGRGREREKIEDPFSNDKFNVRSCHFTFLNQRPRIFSFFQIHALERFLFGKFNIFGTFLCIMLFFLQNLTYNVICYLEYLQDYSMCFLPIF